MLLYEPLSLVACCSLPRKGKTALAVMMAKQAYERGALIYSNVKLYSEKGDWRAPDGRLDSEDPKECMNQLIGIFRDIRDNESWNIERFLILDEFSSIADSQDWKRYSWTQAVWKQLGKLGFTSVAIDQNFSRIYNGYRNLVTHKIMVSSRDPSGNRYKLPYVYVQVGEQNPNNHEEYVKVAEYVIDISPAYSLYSTNQLMYFG